MLESLKIRTLVGPFNPEWKMYELKIYRRVFCHNNEEWYQIWRGVVLSVQHWHEKLDKFWPKHSKISKICTLISCLWPKYIMFELKKSIEELCLMALKIEVCFLKIFVYRLKSSNFILESKMAELARVFPTLASRNRLVNTFVIVFP